MSFTQFLNWLYGLRDRVVWLIQDAWGQVVDVVNKAWSWAVQWGMWAYSTAVNVASDLVNSLHIVLNDTVQMLWRQISDAANWALNEARKLVDAVRAFAWDLYLSVSSYAEWLYYQAVAVAINLVNQVEALIQPAIDAAIGWIVQQLGYLLEWWHSIRYDIQSVIDWFRNEFPAWRDVVLNLIAVFTATNLAKFLDLVNRMYAFLLRLVDDPIGVIVAWFAPILIEWAEDALGHALGAEHTLLPPPKRFGRFGR